MQDVNNDMDDLFRKAAEQYPLRTDGADWQKVLAGLQHVPMPPAEEKEKRKKRLLWLWLLLPLGLVCIAKYKNENKPAQQLATVKSYAGNNSNAQKPDTGRDDRSALVAEKGKEIKSLLSSAETKHPANATAINGNSGVAGDRSVTRMFKQKELNIRSADLALLRNRREKPDYRQVLVSNNISRDSGNKKNSFILQPGTSSARIDTEANQNNRRDSGEMIQGKIDSIALTGIGRDSLTNAGIANGNKSKQVKPKMRTPYGFYTGLLASFDISTVKLQRINKTGYGFDLLVGYRFSRRISVESGITWTKKNYYSTGKYFDKGRTGISPESKIIYTNGSCAMFEIPAAVKYDFAQRKRSNWFATAGLSSYIMKDEKYTYYANHSEVYYTATKKYSNSGSNLFSVASLSLGYQLQLNKHLSLRAEPYIKMPLSGIGIAKMPITSAGITAGFTRSF